jgi:hypothetical protein
MDDLRMIDSFGLLYRDIDDAERYFYLYFYFYLLYLLYLPLLLLLLLLRLTNFGAMNDDYCELNDILLDSLFDCIFTYSFFINII